MKQMIKPKMGKAVSKGKGISLCRYGGLNIVKQKGNYGNDTFHSAPERHGFYAFPYSFVEMFLVGSTKTKEVKEGTYKKFRAIDGYLWTHLKPARQADIIAQKGYSVGNIDSTICLQKPKIKDLIPQMQTVLAEVMNISSDDVAIKATTTEKLGFVGKEEGIAAYATVLIELKNSL